jgi:hypothetical protein
MAILMVFSRQQSEGIADAAGTIPPRRFNCPMTTWKEEMPDFARSGWDFARRSPPGKQA